MGNDTKPIMCASCRVPAKVPPNAKDNDLVVCPECGATDTLRNVMASIKNQAAEYARKRIMGGLRSSKHVKITTKPIKQLNHRFVIDF